MNTQIHSSSLIDTIISKLHISEYTSEQQEQLLDRFSAILFEDLMARFISRMPLSSRAEFSSLLDRDVSEEELMSFIQAQVTDVDGAIQEALQDFTQEVSELSEDEVH